MANTAQSKKRARQAEQCRQHNVPLRTHFRTAVKNVVAAISGGDKKVAEEAYKKAVAVIGLTESKGLIHKNKAARHKSRLNTQIRNM